MRIFDIFNSNGNKIGEIHSYEGDGCFGYVIAGVLLAVAFGGGIASWYLLFTLDDFRPLIPPVIMSLLSMVALIVIAIRRMKKALSYLGFMGVGIVSFTIAMCILVPSATSSLGDFLSNFILGAWFSMIPAGISCVVQKIIIKMCYSDK